MIDGAKALRAGIEDVFGSDQPVQRCRNHKMRNVLDELPREQHAQVINVMRATWKLTDCDEGMKRLEGLARFLEHDYESAARSLREGMAEMFTMQKLKLPPSLYKCLGTTNVIESPQSGVQKRGHGRTMGGIRMATHRKAFPEGHRSSGLLDSRRHSRTRKNI